MKRPLLDRLSIGIGPALHRVLRRESIRKSKFKYIVAWYCRATGGFHNLRWSPGDIQTNRKTATGLGTHLGKLSFETAEVDERVTGDTLDAFDLLYPSYGLTEDESSVREQIRALLQQALTLGNEGSMNAAIHGVSGGELIFTYHPQDIASGACGEALEYWKASLKSGKHFNFFTGRSYSLTSEFHAVGGVRNSNDAFGKAWHAIANSMFGSDAHAPHNALGIPLDSQGIFQGVLGVFGDKKAQVACAEELMDAVPEISWFMHETIRKFALECAEAKGLLGEPLLDASNWNREPAQSVLLLTAPALRAITAGGETVQIQGSRSIFSEETTNHVKGKFESDFIETKKLELIFDLPQAEQLDSDLASLVLQVTGDVIQDLLKQSRERTQRARDPDPAGKSEFSTVEEASYDEIASIIAPLSEPVIILGESGTGKEELARLIHEFSGRREKAFQTINCAGYPSQLFSAMLFGAVKGAYTDAKLHQLGVLITLAKSLLPSRARKEVQESGTRDATAANILNPTDNDDDDEKEDEDEESTKVRQATSDFIGLARLETDKHKKEEYYHFPKLRDGKPPAVTVFLDEIAHLPMENQGSLLRLLDGHGFVPLGWLERRPVYVDTRIVCATNDLRRLQSRRFREDLAWRLATWVIRTSGPPQQNLAAAVAGAWRKVAEINGELRDQGAGRVYLTAGAVLRLRSLSADGAFRGGNYRALRAAVGRAAVLSRAASVNSGSDGSTAITSSEVLRALSFGLPSVPDPRSKPDRSSVGKVALTGSRDVPHDKRRRAEPSTTHKEIAARWRAALTKSDQSAIIQDETFSEIVGLDSLSEQVLCLEAIRDLTGFKFNKRPDGQPKEYDVLPINLAIRKLRLGFAWLVIKFLDMISTSCSLAKVFDDMKARMMPYDPPVQWNHSNVSAYIPVFKSWLAEELSENK